VKGQSKGGGGGGGGKRAGNTPSIIVACKELHVWLIRGKRGRNRNKEIN
jgi:hypothetical protein